MNGRQFLLANLSFNVYTNCNYDGEMVLGYAGSAIEATNLVFVWNDRTADQTDVLH